MKWSLSTLKNCALIIAVLFSLSACKTTKTQVGASMLYEGQTIDFSQTLTKIAFGSCSEQDKGQKMWQYVLRNRPQAWIWLGDNIYMNTEDMIEMRAAYAKQKSNPDYQKMRAAMPILGIWDDNDYGMGDGNKNYSKKKESKQLMLDFLDVSLDAQVRKREGAYQSYSFGPEGKRVKIILLDVRYFKDPLEPNPDESSRYLADPNADILGEGQWQWLEEQLTDSDAQVHIIGSGIQVIAEDHPYEKWADFPTSRQRLIDLLAKTKAASPLLISGDRHIAELSRLEVEGLDMPLYDFTSSGLTHSYEEVGDEPNQHRTGRLIGNRNFGLITIKWTDEGPQLTVTVRGLNNQFFMQEKIE